MATPSTTRCRLNGIDSTPPEASIVGATVTAGDIAAVVGERVGATVAVSGIVVLLADGLLG